MIIHELKFKIKDVAKRLNTKAMYTAALLMLVGFASFGLGRMSKLEETRVPIQIEQQSAVAVASSIVPPRLSKEGNPPAGGGVVTVSAKGGSAFGGKDEGLKMKDSLSSGGQLVASKGGTKYHFPWCSGASRISEANKIWFNSPEDAQKAGYTPAANCKGLR